jgi:microcystin-dependent protein
MAPTALGISGGGLAHENRMPYLTVSFIIAILGIFPSQ